MTTAWKPLMVRVLVVAAYVAAPCAASAQSALATADAAGFMGKWTIALQSPQGAFEQELNVKDESGKVVAEISNQMQTTPQKISDVSKSGADLVLKFSGDFQGTPFTAKITMTPDGADKGKGRVRRHGRTSHDGRHGDQEVVISAILRGIQATHDGNPYLIDVVISRFGGGAESTWHQGYKLAPERTRKV